MLNEFQSEFQVLSKDSIEILNFMRLSIDVEILGTCQILPRM